MKVFVNCACTAIIFILLGIGAAPAQETERHVLKNGITVLLGESRESPLVAIEAWIRTGSATEDIYLGSGISHLVEHMLFKGTAKRPRPGDIEKEIKSLGGYINAFTDHDSTGVNIILPSAYAHNALEVLKDILTESTFDPAELEKEREVVLKEVRLNNDEPSKYASILLWSNMFKAHNYRFPVIGHEELLKKLKRDDLVTYYKTRYCPDNIVLGIAGDIDAGETLKEIEAVFGTIERKSPPAACLPPEPSQVSGIYVEEARGINLAYLLMGFHSVSVRDSDMFALDCLSILLGGGQDSRLFNTLYRAKRLVYAVYSYNHTPKEPGVFAIGAVLDRAKLDEAISQIWLQIEALKAGHISETELKKARSIVLSNYVFSRQTVQGRAGDMVANEVLTGDCDFSKRYVEGINAVTARSVRKAAQRYLTKENLTAIRLIPKKTAQKSAVAGMPRKGPLSNIERIELKNGLKIFILEDHSAPVFAINCAGKGGLRTETFKTNGTARFVSETLLCGTASRSEEKLFAQIEGVGASIASTSAGNTFGLSAAGLSKDWELILDVFYDALKNPAFPDEKIERERAATLAQIKALDDDIYQQGLRTIKYNLFKKHPYRFQAAGRPPVVKGLSRQDIVNYYLRYYIPSNMVIAVSGDIDPAKVKQKIITLFEKLPGRPAPEIKPAVETKRKHSRVIARTVDKEQSVIMLGYPGARIDSHDKYILYVLSSVLSGVNGRLSKAIRDDKGLAYTLDMASIPGIEKGMIIFHIGTSNENLKTAKDELFNQIRILKTSGVSSEELRAAKTELAGLHQMGLQRPQDVAAKISSDELFGLGFDDLLQFERRINRVTKEAVMRAARKYLGENSYVLVTIKGNRA
ncbi:MAG: insulinase family protein [Candidatus Omnitrophica bacterium]|nr:insulinase family protein [Candidatus Omnitrophota bacterium]